MSAAVQAPTHGTETLAQRLERYASERLLMLSDGVFAIVITLSALEIHVPGAATAGWRELLNDLILPLVIYALSFAVTSFYWIGQRRTLVRLRRVDGWFTALSLVFLAAVALLPAATKLLIAARQGSGALVLYVALIAAIALVQGMSWIYAAFIKNLLLEEVPHRYRWAHLVSMLMTPIFSCTMSLIAVNVGGWVRWAALAAIAVVVVVRRRVLDRWAQAPV